MNFIIFIRKAAWSIVPVLLLLFCQWLANTMTQHEVAIRYNIIARNVNNLYSLYIEFDNTSEYVIDEVTIPSAPIGLLKSTFEPPANSQTLPTGTWAGEILPNNKLKALYVLSQEMPTSESALNQFVNAKYRKRDTSGKLVWDSVPLKEGGKIYISGTFEYLLWFFAPILLSLLIVYLVYRYKSRQQTDRRAEPVESPQKQNP